MSAVLTRRISASSGNFSSLGLAGAWSCCCCACREMERGVFDQPGDGNDRGDPPLLLALGLTGLPSCAPGLENGTLNSIGSNSRVTSLETATCAEQQGASGTRCGVRGPCKCPRTETDLGRLQGALLLGLQALLLGACKPFLVVLQAT